MPRASCWPGERVAAALLWASNRQGASASSAAASSRTGLVVKDYSGLDGTCGIWPRAEAVAIGEIGIPDEMRNPCRPAATGRSVRGVSERRAGDVLEGAVRGAPPRRVPDRP